MVQSCVLATSLLLAELFYKFHSFTLECVAFLGTWYISKEHDANSRRPRHLPESVARKSTLTSPPSQLVLDHSPIPIS